MKSKMDSDDSSESLTMSSSSLAKAVDSVKKEGYVVLDNVVSSESLDVILEQMTEDTEILLDSQKKGRDVTGWKRGHIQQKPPHHPPFLFPDIVANPYVVKVTHEVLGDGLFNSFYSGNTNCPGSEEQPIHRDADPLWSDLSSPHPATTLVVNMSPIEVTIDRGSIEIWPGSHLILGPLTYECIERQRDIRPPTQLNIKKGSVLIRDVRLWHRGMPNRSSQIRHMIAMVHQVSWFNRSQTLCFQTGAESVFESPWLNANACFQYDIPEYIFGPHCSHS